MCFLFSYISDVLGVDSDFVYIVVCIIRLLFIYGISCTQTVKSVLRFVCVYTNGEINFSMK